MRLLHTSDWHLGRTLHGEDLHTAQAAMVDQLVHVVEEQRVDAVLVAGDVYDRAVPPLGSVQLLGEALTRLTQRVPVVVVSGNHDSATRLGFGSGLFREGLHVRTDIRGLTAPVELTVDGVTVLVYAVPFLDPDAVRSSLGALNGVDLPRSHEAVLTAAMDIVRADLAGRAPGVRSVVVSHAFVVGASAPAAISDSERDIRVGGSDAVSAGIFAGIDYVALGHLHGAQEPVGPEGTRLRYSGSPLRYSFSEADHTKSFTILDLPAVGPVSVDLVEVQQPRGMARLSGPLAELLESSAHDGVEEHWLQVTVTDDARPPELVSRIRARFPHALVVRHEPTGGPLVGSGLPATAVAGAAHDPVDVARAFVQHVTGGDPTEPEVTAFRAAYERALAEGRSV